MFTASAVAGLQIEEAQKAYNYMGSLDVERSKDACQAATKAIDGLNSLLMVHKHVITGPNDSDRVFVSRATAINCQFLLSDMQVSLGPALQCSGLGCISLPSCRCCPGHHSCAV